ncbi:WD40 repeat-like protein, partial [Ramaria rubella]
AINTLQFSPDTKLLASGASDGRVRIWSTSSGKCIQTISNFINGPVTDVIWTKSKERKLLAIVFACADGTLQVYVQMTKCFEAVIAIYAHKSSIEGIDYDPINMRLATAGGGEAKVWNIDSTWSMDLHASESRNSVTCRSIHFTDQGQSLVATYLETSNVSVSSILKSQ